MARFNPRQAARPRVTGPAAVTGEATVTHEGASAYVRTAQTDLVFMALTETFSNTFYEDSETRYQRFTALVRTVAAADPEWIGKFIGWLRSEANMRSAALVASIETARVMVANGVPGARQIIDSALMRADEPGEAVGYWLKFYGRKLPMAVKRGIGDAALRLYSERSALKYDTASHAIRFGDVLEFTHAPDTKGAAQHLRFPAQGDLFTYLLDRRHNRDDIHAAPSLAMIHANDRLRTDVKTEPELLLSSDRLRAAGMTWEDAKSLGGQLGLDSRRIWEAMIPSMNYMALLRNLRNFDQAGISELSAQFVLSKLTDPAEVAASRQLPFRFLSAYKELESLRWGGALETAVSLASANVPVVRGRSLVLVDVSGSMDAKVSDKSKVTRMEVGALFGAILALRGEDATLVAFGTTHEVLGRPNPGASALKVVEKVRDVQNRVGWGTNIAPAIRGSYGGHDQVFVFTDEQAWGPGRGYYVDGGDVTTSVPANVPLFSFNLGGYAPSMLDLSVPNRFAVGGFSDKLFTLVNTLLAGRDAKWPWE